MKNEIELTNDQYKTLVKLLFYGEWILNANKIGDESDKEAQKLTEYIYSFKESFDLKDWFENLKYGEELKENKVMMLLEKVFEYNLLLEENVGPNDKKG